MVEQPSSDPAVAALFVPAGRWGVAVSGGGDSVALLELLRGRSDLMLHVVHLDHETRAGESTRDAEFVRQLSAACGLVVTIMRRSEIESSIPKLPTNLSARYRATRLALFRRVVAEHQLQGVILAHHADDQAETILQRLLRGSGPAGLIGMSFRTEIGGLTILRPLLGTTRVALRQVLSDRGVAWREDASNQSPLQQRNRVRPMLTMNSDLTDALIELGTRCQALVHWLRDHAPELDEEFCCDALDNLPPPIAREALRNWLARHAAAGSEIPASAMQRLLAMCTDRATPARQHFPGGLLVRRRGGIIFVDQGVGAVAGRVDARASAS